MWNYTTCAPVRASANSPVVEYDRLYISSGDGNIHAIDASTGTKIWNYTTEGNVEFLVIDNNQIYVASSFATKHSPDHEGNATFYTLYAPSSIAVPNSSSLSTIIVIIVVTVIAILAVVIFVYRTRQKGTKENMY